MADQKRLEQGRINFKNGLITFEELESAFFAYANEEEINNFWKAPVYDRPSIIEGKDKTTRDSEFENMISE